MTRQISKAVAQVLHAVARIHPVHTATMYLAPDLTVRVSRVAKPLKRHRTHTYVVTVGKPNYRARGFIKQAVKAGEPFPIRKIQLRFFSTKEN